MLTVRSIRALHGPNIWFARPALQVEIEIGDFKFNDWSAADELLRAQEIAGTASSWKANDFSVASWLGEAAIKLQCAGQTAVAQHTWEAAPNSGTGRLAVEFGEELLGKAAVDFALRWLRALAGDEKFDHAGEWERFLDYAYDVRIGNSTGPIVDAAVARGIPFLRLDDVSLVQFGHGCRQRRVRRAATDRTGMIGNAISTDKVLTKTLLEEIGVPVARGRAVSDAEDAVAAAQRIGWPVVVKPQDADYGNGVTLRIRTEDEVRRAYALARQFSERVLVEQHATGHLFRLLVIGGKLVAAVLRKPSYVVGHGDGAPLETAEAASFHAHRGWENIDQTDLVHPDIAMLAVDAARATGLDIAGVDVIALDLKLSPFAQDFVILEVNSEPAVNLHLEPLSRPSRPVGESIVEMIFPSPDDGRISVIGVLGNKHDFSVAQDLALKQRNRFHHIGISSSEGAWLDDRMLGEACGGVGHHTRRLWRHPRMEAAVIFVTPDDVLREGLPFDRCDELVECPSIARALPGFDEDHRRAIDCVRASSKVRVASS